MSTRFLPIKLNQDKLFGVGLEGTVGRADRRLLQDLADKCLERSRTDVVMDLSGLRSIGGGGAAILADFQRRLVAAGGEAVFAGTSDIVRHFLEQRFEDLPLRCYGDTADAEEAFYAQAAPKKQRARASARTDKVEAAKRPSQAKQPVVQESVAKESVAQEPKPDASEQDCVSNLIDEVPALSEVGAVSFFDDGEDGGGDPFGGASETPDASAQEAPEVAAAGRPNAPEVAPHVAPDPAPDPDPDAEDADGALDGLLSEFSGKQQTGGRRKDHQYMSLHDAVAALGDWSDVDRCSEFSAALNNLLFSHGLAEDVLLLVADGDLLVAGDRAWELPAGGGLADQLAQAARPTTLLDIQETDLDETELTFLETVEPDMILPVVREDELAAAVFLKRHVEGHDYSVGENFAFELLIKVLAEGSDQESEEIDPENVAPATDLDEVLLQLALELPEADDSEQFWRLFLRRTEAVLGASDLAYLAPEGSHPLVITSLSARTAALDLGNDRLQLFFHTIERPVLVANMPQFFRSFRDDLKQAGIHWLVPLAWDGRDLGTVLLGVAGSEVGSDIERIEALFQPTARLLARFAGNNDTADWSLDLVRVLIGQREKRCFGSDKVTEAIVQQVHRLGREMGFAPEQERHLIYGCLLRDVGLVGQDDALMRSPREMISTQRQAYRLHPLEGPKLLQHLDLPQVIIDVIECHHERFNGEGFPQGLQGRQIPLAARVVTVVENYVTMITGAGGRRALTPEQAAQALRDDFGQRYDPDIVSVFLQAVESDMAVPEAVPV